VKIEIHGELKFKENDYLWKYFDLHKFFYFLNAKTLFFTRLDKLEDPLEGLTEQTIGELGIYLDNPKTVEEVNFNIPQEGKESFISSQNKRLHKISLDTTKSQTTQFSNSWFIGSKESMAMWKLYSNSDGIVIRYRPKVLLDKIIEAAKETKHDHFKIFLYGNIIYKDIWPFNFFESNGSKVEYSAFKKDKSFSHENEFRFVTVVPVDQALRYESFEIPIKDFKFNELEIYVNPYMEEWKFINLKTTFKQFSEEISINKSLLMVKH